MAKTNTLTSHHPESHSHPPNKMGRPELLGFTKNGEKRIRRTFKKFTTSKNRMFLKNPYNWDKL